MKKSLFFWTVFIPQLLWAKGLWNQCEGAVFTVNDSSIWSQIQPQDSLFQPQTLAYTQEQWWVLKGGVGEYPLNSEQTLRLIKSYPELCQGTGLQLSSSQLEPFLSTWKNIQRWGRYQPGWTLESGIQLGASAQLFEQDHWAIRTGFEIPNAPIEGLALWLGYENRTGLGTYPRLRREVDSGSINPGSFRLGMSLPVLRLQIIQAAWDHSPYAWLEPSINKLIENGSDTAGVLIFAPTDTLGLSLSEGWATHLELRYGWAQIERWSDPYLRDPVWTYRLRDLPMGSKHLWGLGLIQAKNEWASLVDLDFALWTQRWPLPQRLEPWSLRWISQWAWSSPNNWAISTRLALQLPWIWKEKASK
jgi:hypothetical protein